MFKNKVTEKNIRSWLSENGYSGQTVSFLEVELHAIQRQGWLQIYRFSCWAMRDGKQRVLLHGAVRNDQRRNADHYVVYPDTIQRTAQLDQWSAGLIQLRNRSER